jgi:hypothetical protein
MHKTILLLYFLTKKYMDEKMVLPLCSYISIRIQFRIAGSNKDLSRKADECDIYPGR